MSSMKWADMIDSDEDLDVVFTPKTPVVKEDPVEEPKEEKREVKEEKRETYTGQHTSYKKNDFQYQKNRKNRNPVFEIEKSLKFMQERIDQKEETIATCKSENQFPESQMFFDRETQINDDRFWNTPYSSIMKFNFK